MSTWQAAWRITLYELRTGWAGIVITLIFFTYVGVVDSPLLIGILDGEITRRYAWTADFLYITVLPNLGFLLNPSAFRYWRDDPYTKKLAYWRTLPISNRQIAAGRYLHMLVNAISIGIYFFVLQYVLIFRSETDVSIGAYLNFSLFWMAYSIMMAVLYVYFEQSLPGRTYLIVTLMYFPFFALVTTVLRLSDMNAVTDVLASAREGNWMPTLIMLVIAAAAAAAGKLAVERMIARRNILG